MSSARFSIKEFASLVVLSLWLILGGRAADANPVVTALLEEARKLESSDRAAAAKKIEQAIALLQPSTADAAPALKALWLEAQTQLCWLKADGEPAVSIKQVDALLPAAIERGGKTAHGELRLCRGYALEQQQKSREALAEYEFAIGEGERLPDQKTLADGLVLRGEMRYVLGDYANALTDLKRAYDVNVALKRPAKESYALNAIANLYADINVGEFDRAIEYYRQLLQIHEKNGNKREVATAHFNLGATYERKKDYPAALREYQRAAELDEKARRLEAAYSRRSIGIVLTKQGKAKEALPVLETALAAFTLANDEDRTAQTRLSRGVALRNLGRNADAMSDLEFARAYFQKEGNDRFLEKIHDERAMALTAMGDLQAALQARDLHMELMRKLSERARAQQTSRLRVQFDSERKEQENRALTAENTLRAQALKDATEIQRLQWLAMVFGAAALVALALLAYRQYVHAGRMRDLAMTDALTRLPNRRHLLTLADAQVERAKRDGAALCVLALDIDHFKRVNDNYGHDAGDLVLQRFARACRDALRTSDFIGRTGGEEFIALLPSTGLATGLEIAERVRLAVLGIDVHDIHPDLSLTVSIGVAEWRAEDRQFSTQAKRADEALYRAKVSGRNRVVAA